MALASLLLLAATTRALTLDVDPTGGSLVLEERVAAAVAAWRAAGLDVEAVERTVRVRYGEPSLLGPDVPVLVASSDDPAVDLDVFVHPELFEDAPGALVYAIGIALGGERGEGALDPRRAAGADAVLPSAADAAAIEATRLLDPADLNRDGVVDFEDLLLLALRMGERGVNIPGDLDGDGVVGATDVALMRERYTFAPLQRTPLEAPAAAPPAPGDLPAVPGPLESSDGATDDEATDAEDPVDEQPDDDQPIDEEPIEEEPAD